jgi:Flp pilus assembly protein TadD
MWITIAMLLFFSLQRGWRRSMSAKELHREIHLLLFGPGNTSGRDSFPLTEDRKEELAKARALLEEGLRIDKGGLEGDFHNDMGIVYYDLGLFDDAKTEFRLAIVSDVKWSEPHNNLANAFDMSGQLKDAASEYEKAIALAPRVEDAHLGLCTVLRRLGRLSEALSQAQEAIRLNPSDVLAYHCLGAAFDQLGKRDDAETAFLKAIEVHPAEATVYRSLAIVFLEGRQIDDALIEARKATTLRPDNAKNWSMLAAVLSNTPLSIEAYAAARRAMELDESDDIAKRVLGAMGSSKYLADRAAPIYSKYKEDLLRRALIASASPGPKGKVGGQQPQPTSDHKAK